MIRAYFKVRWTSLFLVRLVPLVYTAFLFCPLNIVGCNWSWAILYVGAVKMSRFLFSLPLPPGTGEPPRLDSAGAKRFFVLRMGLQLITSRTYNAYIRDSAKRVSVLWLCPLQFFKVAKLYFRIIYITMISYIYYLHPSFILTLSLSLSLFCFNVLMGRYFSDISLRISQLWNMVNKSNRFDVYKRNNYNYRTSVK